MGRSLGRKINMKNNFNKEEVNYRCKKCDLCFTEDEITSMDENENDLCPACGKPLNEKDIDYLN